jgi:transcriptional regulator with XRE-family HTH domain
MRTEAVQRHLGGRIRALRLESGWSQEQFAEICGLHRTYMGHVERGEKNISLSTMVRISDALNIPLSELLTENKSMRPRKTWPTHTRPRDRHSSFAELKHVFTELRIERNALKQAIRDLVQLSKKLSGRMRK